MGSRIPAGFINFVVHLMSSGDPDIDACQFGLRASAQPADWATLEFTTFGDNLAALLMAECSTSTSVIGYRMEGANDAGPSVIRDVGAAVPGASGNPMAPQNTAFLLKKGTGLGGRSNRGRNYIPGVPENLVSDAGLVTGANVTAWNALAQTFLDDIAAATYPPVDALVVLHTAGGPFDAATPPDVNSFTMDPLVATQRRRLRH